MSELWKYTPEIMEDKSRTAIIRDYFVGSDGRELDTYRMPELYDRGAHSRLYRRDNLARGMADIALAHMPYDSDKTVLDIGAGTGILSLELARRGLGVTALDLFQPQLAHLQAKAVDAGLETNIVPIQADMNKGLPFSDGAFSAVVSLRATRYVSNFDSWLGEVHRVLESGGDFVLPIFAIDTIPWKRNSNAGIRQPTTYRSIKSAIVDAGFEIDKTVAPRYSDAVDLSLGKRDVPFYYKPKFIIAKAQK